MALASFMEILKWSASIYVINTFIMIFYLSLLIYLFIPSSLTLCLFRLAHKRKLHENS